MYNLQETANNYVIYVRKSTDEKWKQLMSLEDQLFYCKQIQDRDNLNVIEIIEEKKSAKRPRQRVKFEDMVDRIESWEIDWIIARHPDRLARNMWDWWRIIEFVDENKLKDLRFCTQQFSKDANWKMLLWLAFVLSKQYSDKLSDDVSRWQAMRHRKGLAIWRVKYWYDIDKDWRYIKAKSWWLFQRAWKMKLEGKMDTEILEIFKESWYTYSPKKWTKQSQKQVITTQKLSRMFKDTFYFWKMSLRWEDIYLTDLYQFTPFITEEEFFMIENSNKRNKYKKPHKNLKPLYWKIVNIDYPHIEYKPQIIKNKLWNKYLYYVVDNNHKKLVPSDYKSSLKSIRAKKIVDALDLVLKNISDKYCETDYDIYLKKAKWYYDLNLNENRDRRFRIEKRNRELNDNLNMITLWLISKKDLTVKQKKLWNEECKRIEKEIKSNNTKIEELKKEEKDIIPSFSNFLNTMKSLIVSYKTMPWDKKLQIAEILILNTFIKGWEVHKIELNEPFNDLLNFNNTEWFWV